MLLDSKSPKDKQSKSYHGNERPAFTASLSVHTLLTRRDEIVKFDRVILNRGAGYNPRTGVFTAPSSGLYQISATIMSSGGSKVHIYMLSPW